MTPARGRSPGAPPGGAGGEDVPAPPWPAPRSYRARRGRLGPTRAAALERWGPAYLLDGAGPIDLAAVFAGRPVVCEIGSGTGEALVEQAVADPGTGVLAVEVYTAGVAATVQALAAAEVHHVRLVHADAVGVLRRLPEGCLAGVRLWFPDPWPRARQAKRRLVQPAFAALVASRMRVGAAWSCATDDPGYAAHVVAVLRAEPALEVAGDGFVPRPDRPVTGYERRALDAGREVLDVRAVRT